MKNIKNTRSEKIKLLTGLRAGIIKLNELLPPKVLIYDESTGIYFRNNKEISEREFQKMNSANIIVIELSDIVGIRAGSPDFKQNKFYQKPPLDSSQVKKIITHIRENKNGTERKN
ncbi:MAG: hypothetical protein ABI237_11595 [Ginsengibacter sp.]